MGAWIESGVFGTAKAVPFHIFAPHRRVNRGLCFFGMAEAMPFQGVTYFSDRRAMLPLTLTFTHPSKTGLGGAPAEQKQVPRLRVIFRKRKITLRSG
jgi:hypothetical protein